jgi:hypothetical protein
VFTVRYGLNSYILCRRNLVFKGLKWNRSIGLSPLAILLISRDPKGRHCPSVLSALTCQMVYINNYHKFRTSCWWWVDATVCYLCKYGTRLYSVPRVLERHAQVYLPTQSAILCFIHVLQSVPFKHQPGPGTYWGLRVYTQFLQKTAGIVPWLGHKRFLPNPFQFINITIWRCIM